MSRGFLRFSVQDLGLRVWGSGFRARGFGGFRGLGFPAKFKVQGL